MLLLLLQLLRNSLADAEPPPRPSPCTLACTCLATSSGLQGRAKLLSDNMPQARGEVAAAGEEEGWALQLGKAWEEQRAGLAALEAWGSP